MQTMTSASCDADVAELPRPRRRTGPGKDIYITEVAARKSATEKPPWSAISLSGHFLSVREDLGEGDWYCSATGGFATQHRRQGACSGGFTDAGNRLRRPVTWPGNSPAAPHAAVARFWLRKAPDTVAERPGGGSAATPAPNLTHMSLEADAHVMARFAGPLNADATSYSTPGNRPDADRRARIHTPIVHPWGPNRALDVNWPG